MAVLDPNEIFFTAFEPKQANRFIMYMDGFPAYIVKGVGAVSLTQGSVALNQAVMEWVRLHHESVTGRDGYSDFYKKDLTFNVLGPVGDVVSEWIIKGAMITETNFGEYGWDTENTAINLTMTVQPDYCILNF